MDQPHKQEPAGTPIPDKPVLTELELKRLVQLFNALMEVDFHINRNKKEMADD